MSRQIVITLPEWTEIKGINHKKFADLLPSYDEMLWLIKDGTPLDEVIEGIKSDIADFMSEIPTLGNCKEGWHNSGQRIGLEQACEIIDKHTKGESE